MHVRFRLPAAALAVVPVLLATTAATADAARLETTGTTTGKVSPAPTASPTASPTAPASPSSSSSSGPWYGWDPSSTTPPPVMPVWPFHTNVGLFDPAMRSNLPVVDNFVSSYDGQVVQGKRLTGTITVKNANVVFKFDAIEGRVVNAKYGNAANPGNPVVIYSDVYRPGPQETDNTGDNGNRGTVSFYRSNFYGLVDAVRAFNGTVMQDNFVHDLSVAYDSGQSGPSHNDALQIEGQKVAYTGIVMRHNTVFLWGVDNYAPDGVREVATRTGGPNWTSTGDPTTSYGVVTSGGAATATARRDGYTNAGVMVGKGAGHSISIDGNLFRGPAGWVVCATPGNHIRMSDSQFSSTEGTADRRPRVVSGLSNLETNQADVYRQRDPLAGQPVR